MKYNAKLLILAILIFSRSLLNAVGGETSVPAVIPLPQHVEREAGHFMFRPGTQIVVDAASRATGEYLAERLRKATGYQFALAVEKRLEGRGDILLTTNQAKTSLRAEGYELIVATNSVVIRAPTTAGIFYGVQTLLQLLPPEVFASKAVEGVAWKVPCVRIADWPRFKWRGMMLDVSRHFYGKEEVERLLDLMALYKLNRFHWHLVDNDGWRIEIKKYPQLAKMGAWRKDIGYGMDPRSSTAYGPDDRYGGYYTQADIREVVDYAVARHITIVPEIEMPGHSLAALQAYPELNCVSSNGMSAPQIGVYCAGNDATSTFLQNVLAEVFELFPGKYIHVGGDEVNQSNWKHCPLCQALMKRKGLKTEEELQSYFMRRMEGYIAAHGRRMIGWSEIFQRGLAQNAVVMDWIGGGREAAREGHDVIMSPGDYCYFDHYQSLDYSTEPIAIGCYLPLWKVYAFEPIPRGLSEQYHSHILGGQGNVWTEYIASTNYLEYMTFPRLCALAEVVWSAKDSRSWKDFQRRLKENEQRLDELNVNYRRDKAVKIGEWTPGEVSEQGVTLQWDVTRYIKEQAKGRLILDDRYRPLSKDLISEPGKCHVILEYREGHGVKIAWVSMLEDGREIARDVHPGFAGLEPRDLAARDVSYILSVAQCKRRARYVVQAQMMAVGGNDSGGVVYCQQLK